MRHTIEPFGDTLWLDQRPNEPDPAERQMHARVEIDDLMLYRITLNELIDLANLLHAWEPGVQSRLTLACDRFVRVWEMRGPADLVRPYATALTTWLVEHDKEVRP